MTKKRKTEDVLADIREVEPKANADLSGIRAPNVAAHEGKRRQNRDKLAALRAEYADSLKRSWGAILVTGTAEQCAAFADEAKQFECPVVVDAGATYRDMAAIIDKNIGARRVFEPTHFAIFSRLLIEGYRDLDIETFPRFAYDKNIVVKDATALEDHLRSVVRKQAGDELNFTRIERQVFAQAEKAGYTSKALPVVLVGVHPSEYEAYAGNFGGRAVIVDAGAETKTTIGSAIESLKQAFRNKGKARKDSEQ